MRKTLVLNATYEPLTAVTLQRAVVLVLQEKAVVERAHPGRRVRGSSVEIPMPRVVRLKRYVRVPFRQQATWSRRGVLARDGFRCAYCGKRATTVDHVVPRSHGGQDTWLNTVAACAADNHRKANRTPEQAGMRLLRRPFEPTPDAALVAALGLAGEDLQAESVRAGAPRTGASRTGDFGGSYGLAELGHLAEAG